MTRALKGHVLQETKFSFPFRMILAGSSGSGKTHFAGKLLQQKNLFEEEVTAVFYYYPCYLKEAPVDWHEILDIPVSYHVGLPTKEDLIDMPKNSCVVIDDSFDSAIQSSAIDHLFRVISGKRRICVIVMTQNNFTKGRYGREIRNSCNYSVLFRNCCDTSINENVTRMAGLKHAFRAASKDQVGEKYPYIFIDQSQQGQVSNYRLYTDIFGEYKIVWSVDGMKGYIVGATDFEQFFKIIEDNNYFTAKYDEDKETKSKRKSDDKHKSKRKKKYDSESESELESYYSSSSSSTDEHRRNSIKRARRLIYQS